MTEVLGQQFIAGRRSAQGTKLLSSTDAHTGEPLPQRFHEATQAEVDAAARAAASAYPAYRALPASRRAEFLDAIATEIETLGDDFVALVCRETALPAARIQGERARTANQMRLFAQVLRRGDFYAARIDRPLPQRQPLPRPDLRQYRIGVGPVAVFGASNFPLAFSTAGGDTASALAAGCPVVVKAHPGHMITAEYVANAIERAAQTSGMPAGVFNMVFGEMVGQWLVIHPEIRAVGFTGSLQAGRALCALAAARSEPIPVFAEMSSVNPMVLLPEALRQRGERIAIELAASLALGCGQFCTNPGLAIGIRSPELSMFIEHYRSAISRQPPQAMLHQGILHNYEGGIARLQAHSGVHHLASGPAASGQASAHLFGADAQGLIDADPILQHEVFGPCGLILEASDEHQLRQALRALDGQLTATLIADPADLEHFADLPALLEQKAGRLLLNGYPTGVEVSDAIVHGGPWPATSDARGTSVGSLAIDRFLRPVCYQNYPDALLPDALRNDNPLGIMRLVDGVPTREGVDMTGS